VGGTMELCQGPRPALRQLIVAIYFIKLHEIWTVDSQENH